MVTTISWGVPNLEAKFLPAKVDETSPFPPDSKDALHVPLAATEGSTICQSAEGYYEKFHSPPPALVTGIINNCFINSVGTLFLCSYRAF